MSILLLLNGMAKVFLSLHDKHNKPLLLRAIMQMVAPLHYIDQSSIRTLYIIFFQISYASLTIETLI